MDELLVRLGSRYQTWALWLVALPANLPVAFVTFNVAFLLATPKFHCILHEGDSSTDDACYVNHTYPGGNSSLVPCTSWTYETDVYQSTLVSKWDLVCGHAWMISLVKSVFYAGSCMGNLLFGFLSDRYGRKPIFYSLLGILVVVQLIASFSSSLVMFTVMRGILGLCFPATFQVPFILVLEMMAPKKRAFAGMLMCIFFSLSMMALALAAFLTRGWFLLSLLSSVPFVLLFLTWWFLEESPRWYLSHQRREEAFRTFSKIAAFNKTVVDHSSLSGIVDERERKNNHTQVDLFRYPITRFRFLVVCLIWTVIASVYAGLSLGATDLGVDPYLAFALTGLVEVPGILVAMFAMDRVGRRWTLFTCLAIGGAALSSNLLHHLPSWIPVLLANIGKFGISAAFAVIYVFAGELFPTDLRSLALSSCSLISGLGLTLIPYGLHLAALAGGPVSGPLILLGTLTILGAAACLFLPETLDTPLLLTIEEAEGSSRS